MSSFRDNLRISRIWVPFEDPTNEDFTEVAGPSLCELSSGPELGTVTPLAIASLGTCL